MQLFGAAVVAPASSAVNTESTDTDTDTDVLVPRIMIGLQLREQGDLTGIYGHFLYPDGQLKWESLIPVARFCDEVDFVPTIDGFGECTDADAILDTRSINT